MNMFKTSSQEIPHDQNDKSWTVCNSEDSLFLTFNSYRFGSFINLLIIWQQHDGDTTDHSIQNLGPWSDAEAINDTHLPLWYTVVSLGEQRI